MRSLFLIMPRHSDREFDDKLAIIEGVCKSNGWAVVVPSYKQDGGDFSLKSMLLTLSNAELVVADLSLERPSCYFELGIVEATGRLVHLIAKVGTPIHQTSHRNATRYYSSLRELAECFETILAGA